MKNLVFIILLSLTVDLTFAQSEKDNSKIVAAEYEKNYNAEDFDAIFAMFSSDMQKALPLDKTKGFLTGLKAQAGKITKREFERYEDTYASYKTNFERALLTVNISVDADSKINGLFVKPYIDRNSQKPERNTTKLILPFKGEWFVVWGGDTKEQNYHVVSQAQKNAFDILIIDEKGNSHKTNGATNEDYYAFGKDIIAPCDGEVVLIVDGVKDNKPGELNPINVTGNTVIIKTANNEYLLFAHFKQHSIQVKQGQKVKQGQLLGLCGNSGNSSEAHLHFHIQNVEDMNVATGVKCYFEKLVVNGEVKMDYSPIQKDKIRSE